MDRPEGDVRPQLLRSVMVEIVPCVNVDCARYGGRGLNLSNANRHWFADIQIERAWMVGEVISGP